MTKCWPEGELRAYLDRELSTGDMQLVAAHLGECTACDGLCTELAGRAARVSELIGDLPEYELVLRPRPVVAAAALSAAAVPVKKAPLQHRWVPYAVALAAGLALMAYLQPKPAEPVANPRSEPVTASNELEPAVPSAQAVLAPESVVAPLTRPIRRVRKPVTDQETFVAIDDEPFESGVIMRVDVKPGNLQADVVFGPDGRAHAFRLVNATASNGKARNVKASNPNLSRY